MSETKSFFLVIEGLDGSGKSEISRRLAKTLRETYRDNVKLTFEPHDPSAAGLYIRRILTKKRTATPRTLAKAFALNRADHLEHEVLPFLDNSNENILICDRYYLSSLVYQTVPDHIEMEEVWAFNRDARRPDLTIFLYASPEVCYERIQSRGVDRELFEQNLNEKIEKYRQSIQFLRERGECIAEVNAEGSIIEVLNRVIGKIIEFGPDWFNVQRPLLIADSGNAKESYELENWIEPLSDYWKSYSSKNGSLGKNGSREKQGGRVGQPSATNLNIVFLAYIHHQGYEVGERLPWTEVIAYELKYGLPLGIEQNGVALILREGQRYDIITRKIQELEEIERATDFIIVLDPTWTSSEEATQYSREVTTRLSPSICIIGRKQITAYVAELAKNQEADSSMADTNTPIPF